MQTYSVDFFLMALFTRKACRGVSVAGSGVSPASGVVPTTAMVMAAAADGAVSTSSGLSGFIRLPTEGYTHGGRFLVGMRRDQELKGANNTRFRQVQAAICVMPYVLYDGLYCLDVDLVILILRGSLPALIYPEGQGYMNPSLILA
jgi:hypothetical protein